RAMPQIQTGGPGRMSPISSASAADSQRARRGPSDGNAASHAAIRRWVNGTWRIRSDMSGAMRWPGSGKGTDPASHRQARLDYGNAGQVTQASPRQPLVSYGNGGAR